MELHIMWVKHCNCIAKYELHHLQKRWTLDIELFALKLLHVCLSLRWVHVLCAITVLEACFVNITERSPIDLSAIPLPRFRLVRVVSYSWRTL